MTGLHNLNISTREMTTDHQMQFKLNSTRIHFFLFVYDSYRLMDVISMDNWDKIIS